MVFSISFKYFIDFILQFDHQFEKIWFFELKGWVCDHKEKVWIEWHMIFWIVDLLFKLVNNIVYFKINFNLFIQLPFFLNIIFFWRSDHIINVDKLSICFIRNFLVIGFYILFLLLNLDHLVAIYIVALFGNILC